MVDAARRTGTEATGSDDGKKDEVSNSCANERVCPDPRPTETLEPNISHITAEANVSHVSDAHESGEAPPPADETGHVETRGDEGSVPESPEIDDAEAEEIPELVEPEDEHDVQRRHAAELIERVRLEKLRLGTLPVDHDTGDMTVDELLEHIRDIYSRAQPRNTRRDRTSTK